MKRIYSFNCRRCNAVFDELTEHTDTYECPQCGSVAERLITAPQLKMEGVTGSFPSAYYGWEKKRNQKLAQERKQNS